MNKIKQYFALSNALSIVFVAALATSAFGQNSDGTKSAEAIKEQTVNAANTQTVDARQSGQWSVGIDPAKNTVQLANTPTNPLPVKVENAPVRKPFQTRLSLNVPANDNSISGFLPIPAGKRFVIENVSAIARTPPGLRMEITYFTYFDDDFDGTADLGDITFHRFVLTDQGTFNDLAVATANHRVLVFADEQIGAGNYQIGVQVRLSGINTAFAQGQVTFSGYLEDLSNAQ